MKEIKNNPTNFEDNHELPISNKYDNVVNYNLRNCLEIVEENLPNKKYFHASETCKILSDILPSDYHKYPGELTPFLSEIRRNNILPWKTYTYPESKKQSIILERETVLAFASMLVAEEEVSRSHPKRFKMIVDITHKYLGENELTKIVMSPNKKPKREERLEDIVVAQVNGLHIAIEKSKSRDESEDFYPIKQAQTLEEIEFEYIKNVKKKHFAKGSSWDLKKIKAAAEKVNERNENNSKDPLYEFPKGVIALMIKIAGARTGNLYDVKKLIKNLPIEAFNKLVGFNASLLEKDEIKYKTLGDLYMETRKLKVLKLAKSYDKMDSE